MMSNKHGSDPDGPRLGERRRAIRKQASRKLARQYAQANARKKAGPVTTRHATPEEIAALLGERRNDRV
jgi:hypothetical protein